ncbi:calmodulin-related [Lithospermum erythrorhizon]|uniref:Calmodulin-related n=1 Tax=Lithospermum erythrorhizon TaxID=34254 RepID=A0AAV3RG73_LITER
MENTKIPNSFGCFPHKTLKKSLPKSRSKSSSSTKSLDSPKTPNKSSIIMASHRSSTSSRDEEFKEVFRRFDVNNDGKISAFGLRNYFGSIGEHISHEEAELVIDGLDTDGDKMIDYNSFIKLMKCEVNEHEDLRAAFEMFEFEKGCGRITPKSLQRLLNKLGDMKSYDECVSMIRAYDVDGNGELDYYEFHQMMMA